MLRTILAWVVGISIAFRTAGAQEVSARTDTLLARAERGDPQARHEVEALGWQWIKRVADQGKLDSTSLRAMARTMVVLAGPFQSLDQWPAESVRIWRNPAVTSLLALLAADSGDVWSAAQLHRIAAYPFVWTAPLDELVALRALFAKHPDAPAQLALDRIQLELEVGSPDSAAVAMRLIPASATSIATRAHLAAEVAFALRDDSTGIAEYFSGTGAIANAADKDAYDRELRWIAQPDEMREWESLPHAKRAAWLRQFWNRRDIDDGRLPGTRIPEQFRRWRIALRDFRWVYDGSAARGLVVPNDEGAEYNRLDIRFPKESGITQLAYLNRLGPLSSIVDDRGGLVLRHGVPDRRLILPGVEFMSEETMMWRTPDGPLVVSFSRPAFVAGTSQRYGMIARNFPEGDLVANCAVDSRLCVLAGKVKIDPNGSGTLAFANRIRIEYTDKRALAENTDGNPETFADSLGTIVEAFGVPDVGILVVYALPARALSLRRLDPSASGVAARLRMIAGDTLRGEFAGVIDTTRTWNLAAPSGDSTFVTGFSIVPTPPGTWSLSAVVSDLARTVGSGTRIGGVPVAGFNGHTLQLSDLILGTAGSGLSWTYEGTQIPLNPRNAWRSSEVVVLSYQVDGLVPGRSYETHVEVWDASRDAKRYRISARFASTATTVHELAQREVALRELNAGDYRIVLRIRDTVTGAEVTTGRRLALRR